MRYVFHPEALNEYAEAVQYYTNQRVEVTQAFINAIEDTVYRIRESPTRYAVIEDDVRRCMARTFPYGISTRQSKTTFLFWQLCIAAESLDIGKVVSNWSRQPPNTLWHLRGKPGWGENIAFLSTLVNTYGGRWFDMKWQPTIDTPAWKEAIDFYVNLLQKYTTRSRFQWI